MIAFFHQNEVTGTQGGVERFVSSMMQLRDFKTILVTEATSVREDRIGVPLSRLPLPKSFVYSISVILKLRDIRRQLRQRGVSAMEFSRVEYAIFAWLLPGRKTFTIHASGPDRPRMLTRASDWIFGILTAIVADRIQIVGRDPSGLCVPARRIASRKISYIDTWYDDLFTVTDMPSAHAATNVFYSGRISEQKNPEILVEVIKKCSTQYPGKFVFHYFGKDYDTLAMAGVSDLVKNYGLLDVEGLSSAISSCHFGILCSSREGSPFVVVEALACGRGYVLSDIPTLRETYNDMTGIVFARDLNADAFVDALLQLSEKIDDGLSADSIAAGVKGRSKTTLASAVLNEIRGH